MGKGILFGVLAGALGACAWAAVVYYSGHEMGWSAWVIGVLVGSAVAGGVRGKTGLGTGLCAAAVTIVCVFGGRFYVEERLTQREVERAREVFLTDREAMETIQTDIWTRWKQEGREIPSMMGRSAADMVVAPEEVVAAAQREWDHMTYGERMTFKLELQQEGAKVVQEKKATLVLAGFAFRFSKLDFLWLGFATLSAYRIAGKVRVKEPIRRIDPAMHGVHPTLHGVKAGMSRAMYEQAVHGDLERAKRAA